MGRWCAGGSTRDSPASSSRTSSALAPEWLATEFLPGPERVAGVVHEATITLTVDGRERTVTVDTRTSLLDALRERLGVTSPKKGCDHGQCGACTVLLDGRRTLSCLSLAVAHDGPEGVTAAGLARGGTLPPGEQGVVHHQGVPGGYFPPRPG